jgi:hypothetical protein
MFIYLTLKLLAGCRKIVFGQGQIRGESFINGTLVRVFMADVEAVNLVREALKSGKTEAEVVALMRQAGYTDPAVSEILTEAKKGAYPADELARRIAEKNNIPVQQNLPKLGPSNLPSQLPRVQPMPISSSGLDKSIIGMFKLAIDTFLHPGEASKKIKGNVSMGDGAKLIALCGIVVALITSIFILVGMLLLGSLASVATGGLNFDTFLVSWVVMTVAMLIAMPIGLLIGWIIGTGIVWISAKILGGKRSFSAFASEMAFPQVGISLANIVVAIIEFVIMVVIAMNAVASLMSALAGGGLLGVFGAFGAFASTMMIGGIITGLISLVVGIYALYVLVVFIRESMEMSTLRAIVAIFLPLIAIIIIGAVIASVMVGYWFTPLTNNLPNGTYTYGGGSTGGGVTEYILDVLKAYKNPDGDACMSMDVKNNGFSTIPSDVIFEVKKADGTPTGNYVVIRSELSPGESGNFDIVSSPFDSSAKSSIPIGDYLLRLSPMMGSTAISPDIDFVCF